MKQPRCLCVFACEFNKNKVNLQIQERFLISITNVSCMKKPDKVGHTTNFTYGGTLLLEIFSKIFGCAIVMRNLCYNLHCSCVSDNTFVKFIAVFLHFT